MTVDDRGEVFVVHADGEVDIATAHLLGRDPKRIAQRIERAESLNVENVAAAFKKYFPADRYTVVTLMPEGAPAKTASAKP